MMKKRVVRRVLVGSMVACLAVAALVLVQRRFVASPAVRIMPLGDSITEGFPEPGGYRLRLWQQCAEHGVAIDFVGSLATGPSELPDTDHEGHAGWRIDQIDANIVPWLDAAQPDVILLLIGSNDILQHYELDAAPRRVETLLDRIAQHRPQAQVLLASLPPMSEATGNSDRVRAYNAALPALVATQQAAGHRVRLVDLFGVLAPDDFVDSVHPNDRGYRKIADAWYAALVRNIGVQERGRALLPLYVSLR